MEYPNLESDQSVDIGGNFQGEVTVEEGQDSGGIGIDTVMAGGEVMDDAMFSGIEGDGLYVWNKGDYSGGTKQVKYYRGNVDNNWVVFGKDGDNYIWWRIIRNNSNGSLRMIYAGTSASKTSAPATTGIVTQIETSAFNNVSDDNMYVGFKYTRGEVHGTGTNSTILDVLNTWYDATIGYNSDYFSKIDVNAGFCNDREPSTNYSELNGLGGTGTTQTYYGVYIRLVTNKMPSLLCTNSDDIFKTNVGLITADEVNMGGIGYNINLKNTGSYLYTNSHYWTMSPFWFIGQDGGAFMSFVHSNGFFDSLCLKNNIGLPQIFGVRPVINLKADTLFEDGGNGSSIAPYVVVGT